MNDWDYFDIWVTPSGRGIGWDSVLDINTTADHVQVISNAVRWISDSAGESVGLRGSRIVLTGERGDYD